MKKIRYAVVGLGHVAQVAVLPAFRNAKKNSELAALVTGSTKKAKALSKKYKVEKVCGYEDYDELLDSGEIDAVYIALPNQLHRTFSVRALEAGIHVLCEKPLALSKDDSLEMIEASEKSKAKLMTAYRLHFDKPTSEAIQICQKGKLGNLKTFVSSFSYLIKDQDNIRLKPEDGGGPLWDIGIYCINAARSLFKENPVEVFAYATRQPTGPFAHVDESVTATMRFSKDRTAIFTCSFKATESSYVEMYGDKGKLRLENAFEYAFPPELHTQIGKKKTKKKFKKVDQFAAELLYFSECIQKNRVIEPSGEEGLTDVAVIEAINKSIESGKSEKVSYKPTSQQSAPKPEMVRTLPGIKKPELVDVTSASGD